MGGSLNSLGLTGLWEEDLLPHRRQGGPVEDEGEWGVGGEKERDRGVCVYMCGGHESSHREDATVIHAYIKK